MTNSHYYHTKMGAQHARFTKHYNFAHSPYKTWQLRIFGIQNIPNSHFHHTKHDILALSVCNTKQIHIVRIQETTDPHHSDNKNRQNCSLSLQNMTNSHCENTKHDSIELSAYKTRQTRIISTLALTNPTFWVYNTRSIPTVGERKWHIRIFDLRNTRNSYY